MNFDWGVFLAIVSILITLVFECHRLIKNKLALKIPFATVRLSTHNGNRIYARLIVNNFSLEPISLLRIEVRIGDEYVPCCLYSHMAVGWSTSMSENEDESDKKVISTWTDKLPLNLSTREAKEVLLLFHLSKENIQLCPLEPQLPSLGDTQRVTMGESWEDFHQLVPIGSWSFRIILAHKTITKDVVLFEENCDELYRNLKSASDFPLHTP